MGNGWNDCVTCTYFVFGSFLNFVRIAGSARGRNLRKKITGSKPGEERGKNFSEFSPVEVKLKKWTLNMNFTVWLFWRVIRCSFGVYSSQKIQLFRVKLKIFFLVVKHEFGSRFSIWYQLFEICISRKRNFQIYAFDSQFSKTFNQEA